MKRFLMSTVAAGLTLSMLGAPLAMAQEQHPQGDQMHAQTHPTGPQHPVQHTTVEHTTVEHTNVTHTNVTHVSESHATPHPMTHEEQHPAPPMHQVYNGGHQWRNGDHYTGNRTYVSNWNSYHLSAPPAGYQWVQDSGQFVLIAVASGIIANVILNAQ